MDLVPAEINGAGVLLYVRLDERHRATGRCNHAINGVPAPAFAGLAICQYVGDDSYYLFYCDERWQAVTDTWHSSLDDAKAQAEFEFQGVTTTWQPRIVDPS